MSYDLNLFVPISQDKELEESFKRDYLLKDQALTSLSQEDKVLLSRVVVDLKFIEAGLEDTETDCLFELFDQQGVGIFFYSGKCASITIPYWFNGEKAKEVMTRVSKYLYIFGRYGYCLHDPQCNLYSKLDNLNKTILDEMLCCYLSAISKSKTENNENENQSFAQFLPGIPPLQLEFETSEYKADIHDQLASYFSNRENYRIGSNRAFYYNPNTEVQFEFELPERFQISGKSTSRVHFSIELGRPDPYAKEADLELQAFTAANNYILSDSEYAVRAHYDSKTFFEIWLRENPYAVRRFLFDKGDIGPYTLASSDIIEKIWQWNNSLSKLRTLHNEFSVPKLKLWRSTYVLIEAVVGQNILAPSTDIWLSFSPETESICYLIPLNRFLVTSCQCDSTCPHYTAVIDRDEYNRSLRDAIVCSRQEFEERLHSFQRLIQSELVEVGYEANKSSFKTCLKPPLNWE